MAALWKFLLFFYLCAEGFCCNSGWYHYQGKCYKASQIAYSVVMAKRYCQVLGGQLAYVNSTDTLHFLSGTPEFNSMNEYWVSEDSSVPKITTTTPDTFVETVNPPAETTMPPHVNDGSGCPYVKILTINVEFCEEKKYFVCETLYPDQPDICPQGFDHYGSNCYRAMKTAPSNYEDAVKHCALMKSKLATLETEDKEWEAKSALLGNNETFLVAAKKRDGILYWSDDILFNPIHDMFSTNGEVEGDCVGFLSEPLHPLVFVWVHVNCENTYGYLCEADPLPPKTTEASTIATTTTTLAPLSCPHGYNWKSHLSSGYCFWETTYETDRLNWFQAREFCKRYGGDLASYQDEDQEKTGLGGAVGHFRGLWIGLKRDENDVFHWADGSTLNYSNWKYDEPKKSNTKFCVSHSAGTSKWELDYCGVTRWFICKAPLTMDKRHYVIIKFRAKKHDNLGKSLTYVRESSMPHYRPQTKINCNFKGVSVYSTQWQKFEDHCYLIIDKAAYTWDTARLFCQDNGGHMVSIHSFEETDFILSAITGYGTSNYWIGLGVQGLHASYEWTDNTALDFIYWSDNKSADENFTSCVDLNRRDGAWNINHCNRFQGVICKRGENATYDFATTEPTTVMPGNCENGWYSLGNKCYKFFGTKWSQRVSWNTANTKCNDIGASLVSIHNKEEQEFLADVLLEAGANVWIGLKSLDRGSLFTWSDDTRVDFTNWNFNEPEYHVDMSSMEFTISRTISVCVIMENTGTAIGKWNDINCANTQAYMCQKMKDPTNVEPYQDPFVCPNITGWYKLESTCYGIFDQYNMTWLEAQKECQKYDANLIPVKSSAFTYFIKRKLKLKNATQPYFWIGIREKRPNTYEYVTHRPLFYDNWMSGQPRAASSLLDNCVATLRDGRWLVRSCKERHPFICGASLNDTSDSVQLPLAIDRSHLCSNLTGNWEDFGGSNCYMVSEWRSTWVDAMHFCFLHGGYLASFHSANECAALTNLIKSKEDRSQDEFHWVTNARRIHIGFGKKKDGAYGWVDNSPVDFTNWAEEEPSFVLENGCVAMEVQTQKWYNVNCQTDKRKFVCSAPKLSKADESSRTSDIKLDKDIISKKLTAGGIFGILICLIVICSIVGITIYYLRPTKEVQPRLLEPDC